jgi:hypothetical protein
MLTLALVLGAVLAVVAVLVVARPFLSRPEGSDSLDDLDPIERRRIELEEERDRALAALKELEFDHRTGKLTDEDYRTVVGELRRQAAEALRALEPGTSRAMHVAEPAESRRISQAAVAGAAAAARRTELVEPPAVPEPSPPPVPEPTPQPVPEPTPHVPPEPPRVPEPTPAPHVPPEQPTVGQPTLGQPKRRQPADPGR